MASELPIPVMDKDKRVLVEALANIWDKQTRGTERALSAWRLEQLLTSLKGRANYAAQYLHEVVTQAMMFVDSTDTHGRAVLYTLTQVLLNVKAPMDPRMLRIAASAGRMDAVREHLGRASDGQLVEFRGSEHFDKVLDIATVASRVRDAMLGGPAPEPDEGDASTPRAAATPADSTWGSPASDKTVARV